MKFGDLCRFDGWLNEGQVFMSLGQRYDHKPDDGGTTWELVICIEGDGAGSWWTGMVNGAPAYGLVRIDDDEVR